MPKAHIQNVLFKMKNGLKLNRLERRLVARFKDTYDKEKKKEQDAP